MQPFQRSRLKREKDSNVTGLVVTLVFHALLAVVLLTSSLTYLDPPPPERTSLLIEFEVEQEQVKPMPTRTGRQPQAENVDVSKPVELVQKAESPYVNDRPNTTPETVPDTHGDVEVPAPEPEEPKLDPRASFPGMAKKDDKATTPHSAARGKDGRNCQRPRSGPKRAGFPAQTVLYLPGGRHRGSTGKSGPVWHRDGSHPGRRRHYGNG